MCRTRSFFATWFAITTLLWGCESPNEPEVEPPSPPIPESAPPTPLEKTADSPPGTEPAENDEPLGDPIEGSPKEVLAEIEREMQRYGQKITSRSEEPYGTLGAKIDALQIRLTELRDDIPDAHMDNASALSEAHESRVADLKKEWNQTQRQIDYALADVPPGQE